MTIQRLKQRRINLRSQVVSNEADRQLSPYIENELGHLSRYENGNFVVELADGGTVVIEDAATNRGIGRNDLVYTTITDDSGWIDAPKRPIKRQDQAPGINQYAEES